MKPNEPSEFESLCEPTPVQITLGEFELTPEFQALLKGAPRDSAPVSPNEQKPQEPGNASTETGS